MTRKNLEKLSIKKMINRAGEVLLNGTADDFIFIIKRILEEGTDKDFAGFRKNLIKTLDGMDEIDVFQGISAEKFYRKLEKMLKQVRRRW